MERPSPFTAGESAEPAAVRSAHHLSVRGRLDDEGCARLVLDGEIDLASAQAVRAAVGEALDGGAREIVLDLTPVTLLDSTGLSVLLHCARDADRRRAAFHCECPPGAEGRLVIDLAGVGKLLGLTEAEAA
jgi:anti-anti-sigma factor